MTETEQAILDTLIELEEAVGTCRLTPSPISWRSSAGWMR